MRSVLAGSVIDSRWLRGPDATRLSQRISSLHQNNEGPAAFRSRSRFLFKACSLADGGGSRVCRALHTNHRRSNRARAGRSRRGFTAANLGLSKGSSFKKNLRRLASPTIDSVTGRKRSPECRAAPVRYLLSRRGSSPKARGAS